MCISSVRRKKKYAYAYHRDMRIACLLCVLLVFLLAQCVFDIVKGKGLVLTERFEVCNV